jgi:hypothetical protein
VLQHWLVFVKLKNFKTMSSFVKNESKVYIPSEMLEPIFQECIGDWIEMMAVGSRMTPSEFKSMLRALWWVASKAKATHATLAVGNFQGDVEHLSDEQIKRHADKVYSDLYKKAMQGV